MTFITAWFVCWKTEHSLFVVNLKNKQHSSSKGINVCIQNNFGVVNIIVVVYTCLFWGRNIFFCSTVNKIVILVGTNIEASLRKWREGIGIPARKLEWDCLGNFSCIKLMEFQAKTKLLFPVDRCSVSLERDITVFLLSAESHSAESVFAFLRILL